MADFVSSFATGHRQSFAYNLFTLGAQGTLDAVTPNPLMVEGFVSGFRKFFPELGGVREMVFLRFCTGLTGLINTKLSEPGKVVRVNSVGWF
jgi:hypothetical protein